MSGFDEFIRQAREGRAPMDERDRQAERNHRTYLKIRAKAPDYYTKRAREARRRRRMTTGITWEPIPARRES